MSANVEKLKEMLSGLSDEQVEVLINALSKEQERKEQVQSDNVWKAWHKEDVQKASEFLRKSDEILDPEWSVSLRDCHYTGFFIRDDYVVLNFKPVYKDLVGEPDVRNLLYIYVIIDKKTIEEKSWKDLEIKYLDYEIDHSDTGIKQYEMS